jgi:plastocyanin
VSRRKLLTTSAVLCISTAALALAPASGSSGAIASDTARVSVKDTLFSPRSVTVSRGGKVAWRWKGDLEHNVRFRKVPSGASKRGSSTQSSGRFARTFKKRGTYRYVCTIHEDFGMKGSVHVN